MWGEISWRSIPRDGIRGKHYRSSLADYLYPIFQTVFPGQCLLFEDDNVPEHTARCVQTWLDEHNDEVEHLTWWPQSPDLNIIETLWCFQRTYPCLVSSSMNTTWIQDPVFQEEWLATLWQKFIILSTTNFISTADVPCWIWMFREVTIYKWTNL